MSNPVRQSRLVGFLGIALVAFASTVLGSEALKEDWLFQADNKPTVNRIKQEITWTREMAARIAPLKKGLSFATELKAVAGIEKRLGSGDVKALYLELRKVKRQIAFRNPLITFDKILLIDNPKPGGRNRLLHEPDHEARHRNGFMAANDGRLLILQGLNPDSEVVEYKVEDERGSFWRPDLSYDGKKILFCYKPAQEHSFHLYTINTDGTGLKQLTFGDYDDLDPIWLPDGKISFTTSRAGTYVRCMPMTQVFVLARCDGDGKNIYVVSRNNEPDYLPSVMNDGRVIYTRWEYTDKGLWRVQSLWTMNPDGTNVSVCWGNQSVRPDVLTEARQIPNSNRVMFTGVGHHHWFEGCIGIIDPRKGLNFPHGLTKVTQETRWPEVGDQDPDPNENDKYHTSGRFKAYKTPYPLSEEYFLVSARANGNFSLYLMDVYGNKELIYKGKHNAYHAIPAAPRKMPRVIPDMVAWPGTGKDHKKPVKPGVLYTSNVLEGTKIPKDKAQYLRVIEMDPKTYTTWVKTVQHDGPAVSPHGPDPVKRILGTVPIEADGSVSFELPAGAAVFFQLLDADYRAVQDMRSFTGVMPGERRGCVGCHSQRATAPQTTMAGTALRKAPCKLTPPPWGKQSVGYERFVQPTLDKYCGSCHQGDKTPKARKALDMTFRESNHRWRDRSHPHRPTDKSPFPEPYLTLVGGNHGWGRGYGQKNCIVVSNDKFHIPTSLAGCLLHEGYAKNDAKGLEMLPPMTIFTYRSKLYENATSGKHHNVKIDNDSARKLVAWIDCNGPYLGVEEIRQMYDRPFPYMDMVSVRPRVATAPIIDRFNIRQDGDSEAIALGPPKFAPGLTDKSAPIASRQRDYGTPTEKKYGKPIKVRVLEAKYGSEQKSKDVTKQLAKLVTKNYGGHVVHKSFNSHFGDPHVGTVKKLTVTYQVGAKKKTKSFGEKEPLVLK